MEKAISPKRLQREGRLDEALHYYVKRYMECIEEHDPFLSGLYLDEIAHTLIASNQETLSQERISLEGLKRKLSEVVHLGSLKGHDAEQASLDIEISLRKRFPERFEKIDTEESEREN